MTVVKELTHPTFRHADTTVMSSFYYKHEEHKYIVMNTYVYHYNKLILLVVIQRHYDVVANNLSHSNKIFVFIRIAIADVQIFWLEICYIL